MAVILVIDDTAALRATWQCQLVDAGHSVIEAANGAEGLASCAIHKPGLVICDLFMPVMEGIETIREICRLHPRVKIIAMSGNDPRYGARNLNAAQKLGADATLTKPWRVGELIEMVGRLLDETQQTTRALHDQV
jgi:CheY-like chemotaxis protein